MLVAVLAISNGAMAHESRQLPSWLIFDVGQDVTSSFVVRVSRRRYIVPLLGSLVIFVASGVALMQRGPTWMAWTMMAVFAAATLGFSSMLVDDSKRLVIDEDGVWDPNWRIGTVRWTEIKAVFVRSDRGQEFVCLAVYDVEELRRRLGPIGRRFNDATRATGYGDLSVNATKLGLCASEVVAFSSKRISEAR